MHNVTGVGFMAHRNTYFVFMSDTERRSHRCVLCNTFCTQIIGSGLEKTKTYQRICTRSKDGKCDTLKVTMGIYRQ